MHFEVIVVDDGSDDGTDAIVGASGVARVIRCDTRVGLPRARNIGIRASRGELVALTDADTVPDPTWLEAGVAHMRETGVDILGGGVTIALGDKPSIAALVDAMNWLNPKWCVEKGYPLGANMWARRKTFDRWGLFSEEIESYGGDDREWGQRATGKGAHLVYAPDVHLIHPPRDRMKYIRSKAYRFGFALAPLRHLSSSTMRGERPLFLAPMQLIPPRRLALGRLKELGVQPTPVQITLIYLAQWLFVQLPRIVGDFMGELKYVRTRRAKR